MAGHPKRICVHGASGSGKSTLARRLGDQLGLAVTELDAIYHQPGWTSLEDEAFRARARKIADGEAWVVEGNYSTVRPIFWERAELIVVINLPRWKVIKQLIARTLRRGLRREELWNGNREQLRNLLSTKRERNVVLWSWSTHHRYRHAVQDAARALGTAEVVEINSRKQGDELVASLAAAAG